MGRNTFQFKQFSIQQDNCAMKVSTDGILLGSWVECENAKQILDVGAGTGLLSLMIAQRNQSCTVDAIELDRDAFIQCQENFNNSPWSNRLHIVHGDFLIANFSKKYDLIICNPPYFSNSLESPNSSRNLARHDNNLSIKEFINCSVSHLSQEGKIALILPSEVLDKLKIILENKIVNISSACHIHPHENSKPKRVLLILSKDQRLKSEKLIIHEYSSADYSKEFKSLCGSFYLNF